MPREEFVSPALRSSFSVEATENDGDCQRNILDQNEECLTFIDHELRIRRWLMERMGNDLCLSLPKSYAQKILGSFLLWTSLCMHLQAFFVSVCSVNLRRRLWCGENGHKPKIRGWRKFLQRFLTIARLKARTMKRNHGGLDAPISARLSWWKGFQHFQ